MASIKELRSFDLSSFTLISTGIAVLLSVIVALLITVGISIIVPDGLVFAIYLIPTIVVGTLMYSIYRYFFEGYLYNILASKIRPVRFIFNDKSITKVSTTETAIITAIIATIEVILLYLVSVFLLPLTVNSIVETLMYSGQQTLAYGIYNVLMLLSQPTTIAMIIFGTFIIVFVFVLLGTYIYNILANTGRGIIVELSKHDDMTVVESVDVLRLAIVLAVVGGALNLIIAVLTLIGVGNATGIIGNIIGGFISSFISGALIAVFYNFLAPRLGKLKIELIDR